MVQKLIENKVLHPKLDKLKEIIKEQFLSNNSSKMIIFANYRDTIEELLEKLNQFKRQDQSGESIWIENKTDDFSGIDTSETSLIISVNPIPNSPLLRFVTFSSDWELWMIFIFIF